MTEVRLETSPTPRQRERLRNWLEALLVASREYEFAIDTCDGEIVVVDTTTSTAVGIDFEVLTDADGRITSFECAGSILDGVWIVAAGDGELEQREVEGWPAKSGATPTR